MSLVNQQSAYHKGRAAISDDVDRDIYEAMYLYAVRDLGIAEEIAANRARLESKRGPAASAANDIERAGIPIAGAAVLDLGAGLGTMSEELVLRGAHVIALEPGAAWAALTRRRVERHGHPFQLIEGFGEDVPLPDASVDLVVSLQVLEHVKDPQKVLAEIWRVLKPGGSFYLACENYLAFLEGHYRVPWFPLLPKPIAALYLRALGRDPTFLRESVTYVTYPGILRWCRKLGFLRYRDAQLLESLKTKQGAKWTALRLAGPGIALSLSRARHTFQFGVYELFKKPL